LLPFVLGVLYLPLVLAHQRCLKLSIKPEELLLVLIANVLNLHLRFLTVGGETEHVSSTLRLLSTRKLCLGRETHVLFVEVVVLLGVLVVAELDLTVVVFDRLLILLLL